MHVFIIWEAGLADTSQAPLFNDTMRITNVIGIYVDVMKLKFTSICLRPLYPKYTVAPTTITTNKKYENDTYLYILFVVRVIKVTAF